MAFTNWTDLKNKMLDDLESQKWTVETYEVDGRSTKFRSFSEFKKVLDYVTYMANDEAGSVSGRTTARSAGRF